MKRWDVASETLSQTLSGHDSIVSFVALSPNGRLLASGSLDKTFMLWRRKDNVIGSTGGKTGFEATVSQMARTPREARKKETIFATFDVLTMHPVALRRICSKAPAKTFSIRRKRSGNTKRKGASFAISTTRRAESAKITLEGISCSLPFLPIAY